jgi:replicative DNA helicase
MQLRPHNESAERAVLGAMLADRFSVIRVKRIVNPGDFHLEHHKWICEALFDLGYNADWLSVCRHLQARKRLNEAGGETYINELQAGVTTSLNVEAHAQEVLDQRRRRDVLDACADVANAAVNPTGQVERAIESATARFSAMTQMVCGSDLPMPTVADAVLADFTARANGTHKDTGIKCGLPLLDEALGGLQPGTVVTVAGRPGSGKSVLMMQMAIRAAQQGHKSELFSYEMGQQQIVKRAAHHLSGVAWLPGKEAQVSPERRKAFAAALDTIKALPFGVDAATSNLSHAISKCEALADKGLRVVVIDYVQIATVDSGMLGGRRNVNRDQEISAATSALKQMSRRLGITVVLGSQLNRQADGTPPTLGMLRESGGIENDSDVVIGLHTPIDEGEPVKDVRDIHILKSRESEAGAVIHARFDGAARRFLPMATEHVQL